MGASPTGRAGCVAQLVEQRPLSSLVAGPSPAAPSTLYGVTMSIEKRIVDILEQSTSGLPSDYTRETSIKNLGWDSLDVMESICELEEEFNISIDDDDGENWKTLGDIFTYVKEKVE